MKDSSAKSLAEVFLRPFRQEDHLILRRWRGEWHFWNGKKYATLTQEQARHSAWKMPICFYRKNNGELAPIHLTPYSVKAILEAAGAMAAVSDDREQPTWLGDGGPANPRNTITFQNGIFDVVAWLAGKDCLRPHSPLWFSANCLPFEYDPTAECPLWLVFLDDVFDRDAERIACLQEWFGYNLTPDTSHHKLMLLHGPARSGKGTTLRVLEALLGASNCVSPRLSQLGLQFGLWGLLGKMAAICPDAHLGRRADAAIVLETIKSITGEDSIEVQRKFLPPVSARLTVRFTIAVNELPRFGDTSGTLGSRLLILPFRNSYVGREDHKLTDKLKQELPGICNWALAGLRRLRDQDGFTAPEAAEEIRQEYEHLCSPLKAFLDEFCELEPNHEVPRQELYGTWKSWCDDNGHVPGSREWLGSQLRALIPRLGAAKRGPRGKQVSVYVGLKLRADHDLTLAVSLVSG